MLNKNLTTNDITKIAIMAALVFIATYLIKIPSVTGYIHLGDSMVIISALILGKKKGALAAGLGAALCDLLSGYMQYVIPTFLIKAIMVLIIATIAEKIVDKTKFAWVIGSVIGCIFQILGYAFTETIMYGLMLALAAIPRTAIQSIIGIILAVVLATVLEKSNVLKRLKSI